jgi:hypothetical protein
MRFPDGSRAMASKAFLRAVVAKHPRHRPAHLYLADDVKGLLQGFEGADLIAKWWSPIFLVVIKGVAPSSVPKSD